MLQITGLVLDVTTETVNGPNGSFVSTKIFVLDGVKVEELRVGRDFPTTDLPKKDETFSAAVEVSVYGTKAGPRYNLMCQQRLSARVPSAAPGARAAS